MTAIKQFPHNMQSNITEKSISLNFTKSLVDFDKMNLWKSPLLNSFVVYACFVEKTFQQNRGRKFILTFQQNSFVEILILAICAAEPSTVILE